MHRFQSRFHCETKWHRFFSPRFSVIQPEILPPGVLSPKFTVWYAYVVWQKVIVINNWPNTDQTNKVITWNLFGALWSLPLSIVSFHAWTSLPFLKHMYASDVGKISKDIDYCSHSVMKWREKIARFFFYSKFNEFILSRSFLNPMCMMSFGCYFSFILLLFFFFHFLLQITQVIA